MFFCSGSNLAGLNTLSQEDQVGCMSYLIENIVYFSFQDKVTKHLPKVKRKVEDVGTDQPDSKKAKLEVKEDPAEKAEKEEMKKQNKKMFYYRDLLKKHLKKTELQSLLEHNKQEIPTGEVGD